MAVISLAPLPKEKEFEEYCAAFLQLGGHYIERNLIQREEEEVLELDIIVTDYDSSPPETRLVEAKSSAWGFSDLFKVSGWMHYLGITECKFIVTEGNRNIEFVKQKANQMGIDIVLIMDPSDYKAVLPTIIPEAQIEIDENDIEWWRFSYLLERKLTKRLITQKKNNLDMKCFRAACEYYYETTSGVFFTNNIVERAHKLYQTFASYPHLAAKTGHELDGNDFDDDYDELPTPIYQDTFFKCSNNDVHVCFFLEHRARLAILKNAIDYKLWKDAGVVDKTIDRKKEILGLEISMMQSLPASFKEGLDAVCKHKFSCRYPIFWQWFMWLFGGFILKDYEEEEYEILSHKTGIPVQEIPNALESYGILFPLDGGWFWDMSPNSNIVMMKMFPVPFMGVGANYRRAMHTKNPQKAVSEIQVTGKWTSNDLVKWNNLVYTVLKDN